MKLSSALLFLGASSAAAFAPASNHAVTKSSLYMGPPIDPSAPATDLYGEGSRKFRRTVYTHNEWVKHRSPDRFVNNLSTLFNSGIYKNVGKEVAATVAVATFVWAWNMLAGGYQDLAGVQHDAIIQADWAKVAGLPLQAFTVVSPSLGLLLGKTLIFASSILFDVDIENMKSHRFTIYDLLMSSNNIIILQLSVPTLPTNVGMKHVNSGVSILTTLVILIVWQLRGTEMSLIHGMELNS